MIGRDPPLAPLWPTLLCVCVAIGACAPLQASKAHSRTKATTAPTQRKQLQPTPSRQPPLAPVETPPPPPELPSLPPGIVPGELTRVRVPNYRAAHVAHAEAHVTKALVYLHGVCGDVTKINDWVAAATTYATVIAVLGDKPCPTSSARFSWSQDIGLIHLLIERALLATQETRNGLLDIEQVLVFGYSQGASRAERLAALHPQQYRWVILGGPPSAPKFERLSEVERLVLLAGSEEPLSYLRDQAEAFTGQGLATTYVEIPGVGHGAFGAGAPAVITGALQWLFNDGG